MSMWRWSVVVLLAAAVAAATAAGAAGGDLQFPDIQLKPLDGGEAMPLSTFRGRPVLLNFWATWCPPCRMELPELQKVYDRYGGRGLVLAAVNVDHDAGAARRFVASTRLAIPVYRVPEPELRALGIRSIPTSILLDGEGKVVRVYQGFGPEILRDLEERLDELLPEERPAGA